MSEVSKRVAALSSEERAALVMRLRGKSRAAEVGVEQHIPRRAENRDVPLSFAQQRLWFLNRLEVSDSSSRIPAYNFPAAYYLNGQLDVAALERSFNEIIRRHETLRTTFSDRHGQPIQNIAPALNLTISVTDLSHYAGCERDDKARCLVSEEARQPFDLAHGPLLRALLLKLRADQHLLLLTMHHIVGDLWSFGVLVQELESLYAAYSTGTSCTLPELPIQYADYAVWQREWFSGEVLAEHLAYWKRQLGGTLPLLQLPTDHPRPPRLTYRGADRYFKLSKPLTEQLNALSRQEGVTLYMTLLAAFQTLLYRYTGQAQIVVGTPIAGRNHAELESLIGFFVNTLVLRTDVSGNPGFRELLKRVRDVALGAYEHQEMPFEKLVEELEPERDMSRNPLFQVTFTFQNAPKHDFALRGLQVSALEVGEETRFDLELHLWDLPEGISGVLIYSTDLYEETTIERMAEHYQRLLEGVVADPQARLSDLPLLDDAEERLLLVQLNQTAREYPEQQSIHQLFEAQAAQTPDAVALCSGTQQISYRELNERANQLAHHLRERGAGAEVLVGIMVERSVEMVVGLLGILKAGGAYLPLDPEYPLERLAFMLEDAQVPILLTQEHLLDALPSCHAQVLRLDTDAETIAAQSRQNLDQQVNSADTLAYVMYTSGSTGRPKGVAVPHRGVLRLVCNVEYVHLDSSHTLLQLAPLAFDASTFEVWGALLHGARCVLYPHRRVTARQLQAIIREHGVRTMWLTAALYNTVMDEEPEALRGLEQLLIGGEALSVAHVKAGVERLAGTQLINGYGPTETTTFACSYRIKAERAKGWEWRVPIGRPIGNTEVYVLDRQMRVVPVGVVGELYIGGDGLARGYLRRGGLTAERFVPHPYSRRGGARLYRSGDLVRYLEGGEIEFVGRRDEQVKVRGYRIELGEIEAVLAGYDAVREVAVVAREDAQGGKVLGAYVVAKQESMLSVSELRRYLKKKLPDYMIPTAFLMLDEMPLNANGKVDRRALLATNTTRPVLEGAIVAPRTPVEEKMAAIWAEVLGIEEVGVYNNFFELGGHSLLVMQVASRVGDIFGTELPLHCFFESPTIAEQAVAIVQQQAEHTDHEILAQTLAEIDQLSEDEAQNMLADK